MKILVVSPYFPEKNNSIIQSIFVKEQLLNLKNMIDEVNVFSPVPNLLGLSDLERKCVDYSVDNMIVRYPRYFHLPIDYFRKRMDERLANIIIEKILLYKIQFDLIHCHFTWPCGGAGLIIKNKFKKPLVLTIHENKGWFQEEIEEKNDAYEKIWRGADIIFRVNSSDACKINKYNENVIYLPVGYNRNRFPLLDKNSSRLKLGLPIDKKILFSFGNLIERKGFQYLIESMDILTQENSKLVCFIGGEGPYKNKLDEIIHDGDLLEYVYLVGKIPEKDLSTWICASDLFIVPSISESFGLTAIEAMACGRPVVATRNGGSEEIIQDEKVGMLCDVKNSLGMANSIGKALLTNWNEQFIISYSEKYSWNNINSLMIELYDKMLKQNKIL